MMGAAAGADSAPGLWTRAAAVADLPQHPGSPGPAMPGGGPQWEIPGWWTEQL